MTVHNHEMEMFSVGVKANHRHLMSAPMAERAAAHLCLGERGRNREIRGQILRRKKLTYIAQAGGFDFNVWPWAPRLIGNLSAKIGEACWLLREPQNRDAGDNDNRSRSRHLTRTDARIPPRHGPHYFTSGQNRLA